jgi:hypothetical protein
MPTYCDDAGLQEELPKPLSATLTSSYRTNQISAASWEVESLVGERYGRNYESNIQKFPNITSNPATPQLIEQATIWLSASLCYVRLYTSNRMSSASEGEGEDPASRLRRMAEEMCMKIRTGIIGIVLPDGTVLSQVVSIRSKGLDVLSSVSFTRRDKNGNTIGIKGNLEGY